MRGCPAGGSVGGKGGLSGIMSGIILISFMNPSNNKKISNRHIFVLQNETK
jgi:hypothetical protein